VDDGHIGDGDALEHGKEDVPSSTWAGGGAIGGCAGAVGETGEAAEGGTAAALHVGSIGEKHGKAVYEASVELPALELEGSGERETIRPGKGRAAGAAEELGPVYLQYRGERRPAGCLHRPWQSARRARAASPRWRP
jgi:hypothetical protein